MSVFLLLHFEGVTQSYGDYNPGFTRGTAEKPTRSAVAGLLAASLGLERHDPRINALNQSVRVSSRVLRRGKSKIDYHIVRNSILGDKPPAKLGKPANEKLAAMLAEAQDEQYAPLKDARQTYRHYVEDAAFQVAVEVLPSCPFTAEQLLNAVKKPQFAQYFGRKTCRPSVPLVGKDDLPVEAETPMAAFASPQESHLGFVRDPKRYPKFQDWVAKRYPQDKIRDAWLDLSPGQLPPTEGTTLPLEIGDALLHNESRAFARRTALAWHWEPV